MRRDHTKSPVMHPILLQPKTPMSKALDALTRGLRRRGVMRKWPLMIAMPSRVDPVHPVPS